MTRRWPVAALLGAASTLLLALGAQASPGGSSLQGTDGFLAAPDVQEVRSYATDEVGVARPAGLAFSPGDGSLYIAESRRGGVAVVRVDPSADRLGGARLPRVSRPSTISFDRARGRIVGIGGAEERALQLQDARGSTFGPAGKNWFVLDNGAKAIVRMPVRDGALGRAKRIYLHSLGDRLLQGIAFNPADGLLYVMAPDDRLLFGVDQAGIVRRTFSLESLLLADPRAIVFAPSADNTDDPATIHLFIADADGPASRGRILEAAIVPRPTSFSLVATTDTLAQFIKVIDTSSFSPPSPDPAGITYVASTDRFIISDSEVDEMTIYQGRNLFSASRTGSGTGTGTTLPSSKEPSGVGYDPTTGRLFTSDDDADKVVIWAPGGDGQHGTPDDTVSSFSTSAFGSADTEGVEYDPATGHLFVSDGVGIEVYDVNPVDGVFGNGNDIVTHFDVAQYGSRDAEGLGMDPQTGHLLVIDPSTKSIYELTKTGALVRVIDCHDIGLAGNRMFAGVTMAPTSDPTDHPSRLNYWIVDRQVDNGADPNENDGLLYEVSAPSTTSDLPPGVTLTAPAEGATVSGTVSLQATASDDVGVTQVAFSVDGTSIGIDTNGADGWSVAWSTTGSAEGQHTVSATATDTAAQTASDSNAVTVDNVNGPPSVSVTQPVEGAHVRGTVDVVATASDEDGVSQVAFAVDGVGIGTDTNGADGWSVSWNTTAVTDGSHAVSATATDVTSQSASDTNGVTVDNTVPTVAVTAPTPGSTVEGTVVIQANASDNGSVSSVQFLVDGSPIGTDTNGSDGWSASWDTGGATDGNHYVAARAVDAAGNSATSAPVTVTVDHPDVAVLNIPVATGVDDADELLGGTVRRNGGDLELGMDNGTATTVGVRFAGVLVPQGATIVDAYV
ncbi:MAG TPA: Ig-like domain-containing protein, partial [Ilumatobacter sp.]